MRSFWGRQLPTVLFTVVVSSTGGAAAEGDPSARSLTLEQAFKHAFAQSPEIRVRAAEVGQARATLSGASAIQANPIVEGSAAQRKTANAATVDWSVGIAQEISLSGTRGRRIDIAESALAEATTNFERAKRLIATRIYVAFIEAIKAREVLDAARTTAAVVAQLYNVSERRQQAGSSTQLDVNLASAELGRAEGALYLAQGEYDAACALLAEAIGATATQNLVPAGAPPMATADPRPLADLLATARANRDDLLAFRHAENTAKARLAHARAERIPSVALRAFYEREEEQTTIIGGGISVPIPIFDRNQGAVLETEAAVRKAEAEVDVALLHVDQEVVSAHARYLAASRTVQSLKKRVVGTIGENLDLLSKSFAAGKVGLTDVLVIQQSLQQSRIAYIEALTLSWRASIELDLAAGQLAVPAYPEDN